MQRKYFAQVLSATSSRDSVWIISKYSQLAPETARKRNRVSLGHAVLAEDSFRGNSVWGRKRPKRRRARDYCRSRESCQTTLGRDREILPRQCLVSRCLRINAGFLLEDCALGA